MLIYSGVFDRFPNLKLCTGHGGGFFLYHMSRFDREFITGQQTTRGPTGPTRRASCAYLKTLYFDTLVYYAGTLNFLRRKVGAEYLLLGPDFPYVLSAWQ